jgi:hypothetical protein
MANLVRVADATPSTTQVVTVGAIGSINDNITSTFCIFAGATDTVQWCILDLGRPRVIGSVDVKQWGEGPTGNDVGFGVNYSNTPFGAGVAGTAFGTTWTSVGTPTLQDNGEIGTMAGGTVAARYWAFTRAGNWSGYNIKIGDFNVYEIPQDGMIGKFI